MWIIMEEESMNIIDSSSFIPILLLSVEGNIFILLLSVEVYVLVGNIRFQKVPGCLEHKCMVTQLIREAL